MSELRDLTDDAVRVGSKLRKFPSFAKPCHCTSGGCVVLANGISLQMREEGLDYARMKYDPLIHHRRSIRLPGYDYASAGVYFVTICTQDRECNLGEVKNRTMVLSDFGVIARQCWGEIQQHFDNVELDEYVVMPNHVHGLIIIRDHPCRDEVTHGNEIICRDGVTRRDEVTLSLQNDSRTKSKRFPTLGQIVAFFKYRSTKMINLLRDSPGTQFWQHNYYEHIVRDSKDLDLTRAYIANNVCAWSEDEENPKTIK